jgi:hypothetical protein
VLRLLLRLEWCNAMEGGDGKRCSCLLAMPVLLDRMYVGFKPVAGVGFNRFGFLEHRILSNQVSRTFTNPPNAIATFSFRLRLPFFFSFGGAAGGFTGGGAEKHSIYHHMPSVP